MRAPPRTKRSGGHRPAQPGARANAYPNAIAIRRNMHGACRRPRRHRMSRTHMPTGRSAWARPRHARRPAMHGDDRHVAGTSTHRLRGPAGTSRRRDSMGMARTAAGRPERGDRMRRTSTVRRRPSYCRRPLVNEPTANEHQIKAVRPNGPPPRRMAARPVQVDVAACPAHVRPSMAGLHREYELRVRPHMCMRAMRVAG